MCAHIELRTAFSSLLGHLVGLCLGELSVDRMFLSAFGMDAEGITGANVAEAETDRQLVSHGADLVVLADSSNFAQRGPVRLAWRERIGAVVTDTGAPAEVLAAFRAGGAFLLVFYEGYRNNAEVAAPICNELGVVGWLLVAKAFIDSPVP